MITISATQNSLGKLTRVLSFSQGISLAYTWIYENPSIISAVTADLDAEYLLQGDNAWGRLRDKSCEHLQTDGDIVVATQFPKIYPDTWGHDRIKSGSTYYGAHLICDVAQGGFETHSYPAQTTTVGGYRYVDTDIRRTFQTSSLWDSIFNVVVTENRFPSQMKYRVSDGLWMAELPGYSSFYVNVAKKVSGVWRQWKSLATSIEPSSTTIQGLISSGTLGAALLSITTYDVEILGSPTVVMEAIRTHIEGMSFAPLHLYCDQHPADFGELAVDASKSLRYVDNNILLIVEDMIRLPEAAASLLQILSSGEWKAVLDGLSSLKEGAISLRNFRDIVAPFGQLYLSWKYVYAPNLSDLSSIGRGIAKAMFSDKYSRVHSRKVTEVPLPDERVLRHTAVFTAEVNTLGDRDWGMLQEFVYLGKRWGMYPELENLWDILMFSFVVDWFVQFGDFFQACDAYMNTENYFPVRYCILSEKWEYHLEVDEIVPLVYLPWASGNVIVSRYSRWITREVPLPSVELSANTSLSKHWAEAGFLVALQL